MNDTNEKELREIFCQLHRFPELSGEEVQTAGRISGWLEQWGIPHMVNAETHAVVGCIEGTGRQGPVIALRADMDALPIAEPAGHPVVSEHPGVMHACGHDVHMTILLGVARTLQARRDALPGTVRLLFEPAEETIGGAKAMIAQGCLRNPQVQAVLGLHVVPELPVGRVRYRSGAMSGASDTIRILLQGRAAHGAYPHRGVDAIVMAAQVVSALQTLVSRETAPLDSAALTLGTIAGGTASNILADTVELTGTLRTLSPQVRERLMRRIAECAQGIAAAMDGSAEVDFIPGYPALYNDDALASVAARCFGDILAQDVQEDMLPSLGVESFSFFVQEVPGFFYDLGCDSPGTIHTREFCVNPECLALGVRLQTELALATLAHLG